MKCTNAHVIQQRAEQQPIQVGVGVPGGAKGAIHAMRRLTSNMSDDHVIVKLDFFNAYNTVRIDTVLESITDKMPELYRFIHASLACPSKLSYGT